MTKKEFLRRCEAQWDSMEKLDENVFYMMYLATDYVCRKQGGQNDIADANWSKIQELSKGRTLYNFRELYKSFNFSARLANPCQECAENPNDWGSRWGWCNHEKIQS